MRAWLVLAVAAALALGCSLAQPAATALPADAFRVENGTVVADEWPAQARPYGSDARGGLPAGFVDELVVGDLDHPTSVRQLPDGSFLLTEQRGMLLHAAAGRATATPLLDLRAEVLQGLQLGLLGLALDPEFESEPYVYLAYTRDAPLGGVAPTYGAGSEEDACPVRSGCLASARLVRYRLAGNPIAVAGDARVLIDDWCVAGPNHTIGTIAFDSTGALYAGGGDGADGAELDYGQIGQPANGCGDPPTGPGVAPSPPDAQGGSLRSQDALLGSDPLTLDGTIIRIDRATGHGLPDNPLGGAADPNARRIVGYGMRNPYRFTFRPGTDELWIADVGWLRYEEINRISDPLAEMPFNLGWPCYEGAARQPDWEALGFDACRELYERQDEVTFPAFALARGAASEAPCATGGAALSGLVFYDGAAFPEELQGALFFADHARGCIFVMQPGRDGLPDPHTVRIFASRTRVVDMIVGADGALYYVDLTAGELRRIAWR